MSNPMRMEIKGADALLTSLKDAAKYDDVKRAVKVNTIELAKGAVKNAQFKGHYRNGKFIPPTGFLRRSIQPDLTDLVGKVNASAEYAPYVELGTRYMAAQPFMAPAMLVQRMKFLNDLKRIMK